MMRDLPPLASGRTGGLHGGAARKQRLCSAHGPAPWAILLTLFLGAAAGCGPNAANIELRKINQDLTEKLERLENQQRASQATIAALESRAGTVPSLPSQRIDRLYTTHGLQLGRLTGGGDWDPARPGDEGVQVQVVPLDQENQPLKAAGTFVVEAFDLTGKDPQRIGRWEFDHKASQRAWLGLAFAYHYLLKCPWQQLPSTAELTLKVTFTDELTGRQYDAQKAIQVSLPAAPATGPATSTR